MTQLTQLELKVLQLISTGMPYTKIAFELSRSYDTVKSYSSRIRAKLGLKNKVELANYYHKTFGKEVPL